MEDADVFTVWGSAEQLMGHPLLYRALSEVWTKIKNCLSRSYDICDKDATTDHESVLLGLKGQFMLMPLEDDEGGRVYGETGPASEENNSVLILLNEDFVNASTAYWNGDGKTELETESYLAFFHELIEHELAHAKMHQENFDGLFDEVCDTPPESPLYSESGYAVQHKIRQRAAPPLHTYRKVLEISSECADHLFPPPLGLALHPVDNEGNVLDPEGGRTLLTLEELRNYMVYPVDCNNKKRPASSSVASGSNNPNLPDSKRGKEEDDEDKKPASRDDYSSPQKTDSNRQMAPLSDAGNIKQTSTDAQGKDRHDDVVGLGHLQGSAYVDHVSNSVKSCDVSSVVFCDAQRRVKNCFLPSEAIYVLLTFKNATNSDAYIRCCKGKFHARCGIFMKIIDHPMKYSSCAPRHGNTQIRLCPGEEYSLFRRLCLPADAKVKGSVGSRITTPEKAREYTAVVRKCKFEFPGKYTFTIGRA